MTEPLPSQLLSTLFRQSRWWFVRAGVVIQVFLIGATGFFIRPSSDTFILRYNAFFGVDILGTWWQVYLIPGIGLLLFVSNLAIAEVLFRRQAVLAALILLFGTILLTLSEVIAMVALISINS